MNFRTLFMAFALAALIAGVSMPVVANEVGCTPGYWKNHPAVWPTPYSPGTLLTTVFPGMNTTFVDGSSLDLTGLTMMDALDFDGGPTVADAAKLLLKAAVAAILNSAHPLVGGWTIGDGTSDGIIAWVKSAMLNGDPPKSKSFQRGYIIWLKDFFDATNNAGCPINAFGQPS